MEATTNSFAVDRGPPDNLLAVTRPLTGAYYVIPSADRLAAFGGDLRADT